MLRDNKHFVTMKKRLFLQCALNITIPTNTLVLLIKIIKIDNNY